MSDGTERLDPLANVKPGQAAEKTQTVTRELTVGHFVDGMPLVFSTPMMIMLMEMTSGAAISPHLPPDHVSVGMAVNIRHLAATPVGRTVRATSRVIETDKRSVLFEVEAWDGDRKIGDGTHRRGVVHKGQFEKRFDVT